MVSQPRLLIVIGLLAASGLPGLPGIVATGSELPPESALPGDVVAPRQLPAESALPQYVVDALAAPPPIVVLPQSPAVEMPPEVLPIPSAQTEIPAPDESFPDDPQDALLPEETPPETTVSEQHEPQTTRPPETTPPEVTPTETTPTQTTPTDTIPPGTASETQPDESLPQATVPHVESPSSNAAADRAGAPDLPSESELPTPVEEVTGDNVPPDEPREGPQLPLAGSPDGIPWLAFAARGHTGPIRAMEFSTDGDRLLTAGEDKTLIVWREREQADDASESRWTYERTIRWQIQRGTRGRILALAAVGPHVAIAGEGAMGGTGEILLVDPVSGELAAVINDDERGNLSVVTSLAAAREGEPNRLASLSKNGRIVLWKPDAAGLWQARVVRESDEQRHDDLALRTRLDAARAFDTLEFLDADQIVYPSYRGLAGERLTWTLEVQQLSTGTRKPLRHRDTDVLHFDRVTSVTASKDGKRLVSADGSGNVFVFKIDGVQATAERLPVVDPRGAVLSASLSRDGTMLVIGTAAEPGRAARVERWDLSGSPPRRTGVWTVSNHVFATAIDPDGEQIAWSDRRDAVSISAAVDTAPTSTSSLVVPPNRVAFSKTEPFYRLASSFRRRGPSRRTNQRRLRVRPPAAPAEPDRDVPRSRLASGGLVSVRLERDGPVDRYRCGSVSVYQEQSAAR